MRLPLRPGRHAGAPPLFYGWRVVTGASLVGFVEVALFNPVLGVFIQPLSQNFGWSRAAISLAITLGTLGAAVSGPLLGPYLDHHGPRLPLNVAIVTGAACLFALSSVRTLWQFDLFFGLGRAVCVGIIDVCASVTVSKWFVAARGRAISISILGQRLGQTILPLLVQALVLRDHWRLAWSVLGIIVLVVGMPPALLVVHGKPEDRGLLPDGVEPTYESRAPAVPPARPVPGVSGVDFTLRQALHSPAFWLITVAVSQALLVNGSVNLHQLAQMEDRGIPPALSVLATSVYAIMSAVGALLASLPRRRIGASKTFGLYLFFSAGGLLMLIGVHQVWQAYAYAIVYGIAFGGQITMQTVVYADIFGRAHLGAIRGLAIPVQLTANAIGPVFAGWIYDRSHSYVIAFAIFAVLYALAGIFCWLVPAVQSRSGEGAHVRSRREFE